MLGLDISSSSVKLLELSYFNSRVQIETYAIAPLPDQAVVERKVQDPVQVGETIRLMIEHIQPSTRNTITAVSGASVITRKIQMSASLSPSEMEAQIIVEADQFITFPINEVAIDFEVISPSTEPVKPVADNPKKRDVLLVACRLETVEHLQSALEHGGLLPKVIDVENYAIERAVSLLRPHLNLEAADPLIAVVDIGVTLTNLSVLHRDETIYSRDQTFGGKQLTDGIMQHFNISYTAAEAAKKKGGLPREILQPFQQTALQQINRALQLFYSSTAYRLYSSDSHRHIDYILLTGGSSSTEGLAPTLQTHLKTPTSVANPFVIASINDRINRAALDHDAPALMTAFGLAMRGFNNATD